MSERQSKGLYATTIPLDVLRNAIDRSCGSIVRLARILDVTETQANTFVLNLEWIDVNAKLQTRKKHEHQFFDSSNEWYERVVWNKNYNDGFGEYKQEEKTVGKIKFPWNGKDK